MKNLLNERSGKLFKKLFENQGIDTGKYENYSLDEEAQSLQEGETPEEKIAWIEQKPKRWRMIANEFADMAEGGDADGLRPSYYPNWSDDDFKRVIAAVEGG